MYSDGWISGHRSVELAIVVQEFCLRRDIELPTIQFSKNRYKMLNGYFIQVNKSEGFFMLLLPLLV